MTRQQVVDTVKAMPAEERYNLVLELWDLVAPQSGPSWISEDEASEIDRRLAAHEKDPNATVPWEQVKREVLGGK